MEQQQIINLYSEFMNGEYLKLDKLYQYYMGNHDILNKRDRSAHRKDARNVSNYPRYITTVATSYFLGKPILYSSDKPAFKNIEKFLATEEEQHLNNEIATYTSIYGKCYELFYINNNLDVASVAIDPKNMIVIYDSSIQPEIIFALRFNSTYMGPQQYEIVAEVYDYSTVKTYRWIQNTAMMTIMEFNLVDEKPHQFGRVPVLEYKNNDFSIGDFEQVTTLVDTYNMTTSSTVDDMLDFSDSYLALTNLLGTEAEDIEAMRKSRVLLLSDQGKAEWITKNVDGQASQLIMDRLASDIHKFSFIPDLSSEEFMGGNQSGVAIRYKLLALEQLSANKENCYKKTLNKRLQFIIDYYNIGDLKPYDIAKRFTRNIPVNLMENADVAMKLNGILSQETVVGLTQATDDIQAELGRIEKERNIFSDYNVGE